MGAVEIVRAGEGDAARWDAFVEAAPEATLFHRFGWSRVIARAYGYEGVNLMAVAEGRVVGVLPLTDVRSPLLGRSLISTAFTVGGGAAARDPDVHALLAEAAEEEGRARRVRYVELRGRPVPIDGWAVKDSVYAGFEKELPADEGDNLKMIPRSRRAGVRKGMNAAKEGAFAARFDDDVDGFYRLYANSMRDLGTPIFPRRFIREISREFDGETEMLFIDAGGAPVLSLFTFYFRDRVMPYYFGARPDARAHGAYDYAIWLQMRRAAARGARVFDFGRSKYGSGPFAYKSFWGFEAKPLEYQYRLIGARETPNVNPQNPKFAAASSAWKRLPLALANAAGPLLARHLA
ncbi:MAG: FemAB family XrtA/PEP-CTERM system-associated protein [Pseudomonadota bacterium]|nr:FemAB family XrtA/PEP-CTERM system-associated protein [Pseudomonadota bacterium]